MTPKDPENFNFTDLDDKNHQLLFAGTPDAVSCWAKFKSGGSLNGRGQFILHDEYEYRDPESSNETGYENHKIALAAIIITESSEWTYFEAPFTYTGVAKPEKQYMLASFTTNPEPGGSINDELIIDDVKLIYYSQLASLSYNDTAVKNFDKDTYNYKIDAAYDESKLEATADGVAATIEKTYNEETGVLTITVKGDDWEENKNEHVYTIQFKTVTEYTNSLLVNLGGTYPTPPAKQTIQLIKELDGSYSFFLADFSFGPMSVGDIKMTNLNRTEDGNKVIYEQTQDLSLMNGLLEVTATLHAEEENGLMIANIDIPDAMASFGTSGVNVYVTFAPALEINEATSFAETTGLYNITYTHTFPAGWSTVCLPFSTTQSEATLNAGQVQEFTAFADNTLTFNKLDINKSLTANTPYLVYYENETEVTLYGSSEDFTPAAVTFGDVTFTGNYTAGKDMEGLYGVADKEGKQYIMKGGAGSTLGSTGAYFTVSGTTAGVNTLSLDIEGEGTTGIESIVAEEGQAFDVYTLTGVKIRTAATDLDGLQRGIYIVNGKKVLVK